MKASTIVSALFLEEKGKALGTESDSVQDALNWNLLSQAWKGVALPSKLFQDQKQICLTLLSPYLLLS